MVSQTAKSLKILGIICSILASSCAMHLQEEPVAVDSVLVESVDEVVFINSSRLTTLVLRLFESGLTEADCIRAGGRKSVGADRKLVRVQMSSDEIQPLLAASRAVPEFSFDHVVPDPTRPSLEFNTSTTIVLNFPSGKQGVFDIRNDNNDMFLKGKDKSHDKFRALLTEIYKARDSICKGAFLGTVNE